MPLSGPRVAVRLAALVSLTPQAGLLGQDRSELPLATTTALRFTATEGTWISLDVAPDGRSIVFDLLGDLYTLPIGGGRATRLTSGAAFDAQPRYSPDGQWIVFVSDRNGSENVWLISPDGKDSRPLTTGPDRRYSSPEWTPDGRSVLLSRGRGGDRGTAYPERNWELVRYLVDGGSGQVLDATPTAPADNFLGAAPGPDGRHVYLSGRKGELATAVFILPLWQLFSFDLETREVKPIAARRGGGVRPAISADGRWMVYGTRREKVQGLRLRDLRTGDEKWLAPEVDKDEQETLWQARDLLPGAAFTPDGAAFIASFGGKIWRLEVPSGQATEIPFSADVDVPLSPRVSFDYRVDDDSMVTASRVVHPAISPNGRQVAYSAIGRIWVSDLPNGRGRALTDGGSMADFPVWSPDGVSVAYVTWSDQSGGAIERRRADGSGSPERLTRLNAYYEGLASSPDGSRLVAARGRAQARLEEVNEPLELISIPGAGGEATVIAPVGSAAHPHFGPEPDRVYLLERGALVSMRLDGTDRQTRVKIQGSGWVSDAVISPDGRQLLVQDGPMAYLVSLPAVGGGLTIDVTSPNAVVPVRRLSEFGAEDLVWSPDGSTAHYVLGRTLFSHSVAKAGPAATVALTAKVGRDRPTGTVVLRGARVITLDARNRILQNADVVVTDNRITAVGQRGSVSIPRGARVVDVAGKTIVPGWIDIHAHIFGQTGVSRSQRWDYISNLAYGVTTTRDPAQRPAVFGYSDLVDAGAIMGPRTYSTGDPIYPGDDIRSLDDARRVLRRYSEFLGTHYLKQYGVGERRVRQWVIMAAKEQRLTAVVEPYMDLKKDLTEVMDGYPEMAHNMARWPLYDDVVRLFATTGVALTQTLVVTAGAPMGGEFYYENPGVARDEKVRRFWVPQVFEREALRRNVWFDESQYAFKDVGKALARITAAGGTVTLGAHGEAQGVGVHWELEMMGSGGMPPIDVIRTGTINAAKAIGLSADLGSIEVGKLADLQVLDRDPLTSIRNTLAIKYVMKNGRLYLADTMREVWPRERELDHPWWWNPNER